MPSATLGQPTSDLIFDFFGTLVAYTPGHVHSEPYQQTHALLCAHGFPISYDSFIEQFNHVFMMLEQDAKQTSREFHMDAVGTAFFATAFGSTVTEPLLHAFVRCYIQEWSRTITILPGIHSLLTHLAQRYRLSIVSNTHYPDLIHTTLASMGCTELFSPIITSVEVGIRKPHPAIFATALERLAISADAALYIGDTFIDDYQGATAAQIACVLIDPADRYPDIPGRIHTIFDLEAHLL